jgi:phosphatidate cytidylyltransferase
MDLKKRLMSGLIGFVILMGVLLGGQRWGCMALSIFISFLGGWEFFRAVGSPTMPGSLFGVLCGTICTGMEFFPADALSVFFLGFGLLCVWLLLDQRVLSGGCKKPFADLHQLTFGLVYCGLLPSFLGKLGNMPGGTQFLVWFLLIVFSCDIAAYAFGRLLGRQKLYPAVSPNKTVAGSIAGLFASIVLAPVLGLALFRFGWQGQPFVWMVGVGFTVGVLAQLGDLLESFIKRAFEIKDFGSLLPGHGGILDRFDAVLFSAPAMVWWVKALVEF